MEIFKFLESRGSPNSKTNFPCSYIFDIAMHLGYNLILWILDFPASGWAIEAKQMGGMSPLCIRIKQSWWNLHMHNIVTTFYRHCFVETTTKACSNLKRRRCVSFEVRFYYFTWNTQAVSKSNNVWAWYWMSDLNHMAGWTDGWAQWK